MRNLLQAILNNARSCKTVTACAFLAFTAFLCVARPLVRQVLPEAHDIVFHLFQADQLDAALRSGAVFPHWVADSNNGYGTPNFIFYAPLSYYFTTLVNLVAGSMPLSIIVSMWFSFFFSGIAMFSAVARTNGRDGALVSAILYQVLPFHLLDLYSRGSFAELFAFPWLPLIFLCVHGIFSAERKHAFVAGLSVSYAALILTHLVSGYIFTFILVAFVGFNYLLSRDKHRLSLALAAVAGGLGLASFYLLPAFLEQKFVHIDFIRNCAVGNYRHNFLFLVDGATQWLREFRLMLHVAAVMDLVLFLSLVPALLVEVKRSDGVSLHYFFLGLFLFTFFLTTPLSMPLWTVFPGFASLQFPWRFMSMMEVSLCFLMGAAFSAVCAHSAAASKYRAVLYSLTAVLLVSFIIVGKSNSSHPKEVVGSLVVREYTPVAVTHLKPLIVQKQVRVATVAGIASSGIPKWHPEQRVIEVSASSPAVLRIATSYYPGWEAQVDGLDVPIGVENQSGAILIAMPPGRHTLTLNFGDTPTRRFAKYLSLLSLGTLLLYVGFNLRRPTDL